MKCWYESFPNFKFTRRFFFILFWVTLGYIYSLLLTLCPGITPGELSSIWGAGARTKVGHIQVQHPPRCTVAVALPLAVNPLISAVPAGAAPDLPALRAHPVHDQPPAAQQ